MELNVRDLAERLLPLSPDGDIDALLRQLRHWTISGMLQTSGELHTGAGRSRKYDETEIYYAALAMELTRWRIPVGIGDLIMQMARDDNAFTAKTEKGSTFTRAVAGTEDIFFCIRLGTRRADAELVSGELTSLASAMKKHRWTADFPSFIAINLTTLFTPLRT